MKNIILTFLLLISFLTSTAQVYVNGYYRKDGTYVKPHYRSNPDGNPYNNWSYPGNVNPYTGKVATGNPSTYLRNYYKIYPNSGTSSSDYFNYTSCLVYTNYKGLKTGYSYTLTSNNASTTGYVKHYQNNKFKIYDTSNKHIGYVYTRKKGRRYEVYDLYGYEVTSNRFRINWSTVGSIFLGGALVYLLVEATSY
ncbi:hypothetical protein LVD15_10120 [Fulvivirga maritima]|uniref:hypothetical protein n=1 Tax=Fulvivirga maritima TaxID=2904247 RepID=UPI001F2F7BD2|nr:hypothetical protein [Fulvivirga maritima]UII28757.1 hypothetical protein LVD15_10120 [Fulvivirga maritima]